MPLPVPLRASPDGRRVPGVGAPRGGRCRVIGDALCSFQSAICQGNGPRGLLWPLGQFGGDRRHLPAFLIAGGRRVADESNACQGATRGRSHNDCAGEARAARPRGLGVGGSWQRTCARAPPSYVRVANGDGACILKLCMCTVMGSARTLAEQRAPNTVPSREESRAVQNDHFAVISTQSFAHALKIVSLCSEHTSC